MKVYLLIWCRTHHDKTLCDNHAHVGIFTSAEAAWDAAKPRDELFGHYFVEVLKLRGEGATG